MKKLIILTTALALAFASTADIKDRSYMKYGKTYTAKTKCIDGYKFLIVSSKYGISVVQIYEARGGTKPSRPIECD